MCFYPGRGRPGLHESAFHDPRFTNPRFTRQYNTRVTPVDKPSPDADDSHPHRHGIYATETVGLLLIAVLLLALTLIRYWHYIRWSLR